MTDWNNLKYTGFDSINSIAMDGISKIWTASGANIVEWIPASGTRTPLTVAPAAAFVTHFKGDIYIAWYDSATPDCGISRYDAGTWTRVYSPIGPVDNSIGHGMYIVNVNDSYMVAIFAMDTGGRRCVHSVDGVSWVQGMIGGSLSGYMSPVGLVSLTDYTFGFLTQQVGIAFLAGSQNPSNPAAAVDLYQFNFGTGDWEVEVPNFTTQGASTNPRVQSRGVDKWWKTHSATNHYYSTDLVNWTLAPEGSDPANRWAAGQLNMPYTAGVRMAATGLQFWDDSILNWNGVDELWFLTYGPGRIVFRFNDGATYLITRNNSTSTIYLIARGAAILDGPNWPPGPRFYSGVDSLSYRSKLPFDQVETHGLAVRADGVAAIGNAEAGAQQVVQGDASDDYAAWTDVTADLATDGVKALDWING